MYITNIPHSVLTEDVNAHSTIVSHSVFQNIDVLSLTETWLCCGDNAVLNELLSLDMILDMSIGKGEVVVKHSFIKNTFQFEI